MAGKTNLSLALFCCPSLALPLATQRGETPQNYLSVPLGRQTCPLASLIARWRKASDGEGMEGKDGLVEMWGDVERGWGYEGREGRRGEEGQG